MADVTSMAPFHSNWVINLNKNVVKNFCWNLISRVLLFSHGSHYKGSESWTTNSNSGGEGTFLLEVDGDADDGGEVDEAEAEAGKDTHGEIEDGDGGRRRGQRHPRRR